ncbi:hypothetical protein AGLY_010283 [Aphis glycines]|uniref:Uncharacterized protein n=1 Tax=Aphis glycines TaxID=307491 RepID=A0A6G0TG62_APHGL|nr:hypothetical protein AGLY_010283 [Aphis glycines]
MYSHKVSEMAESELLRNSNAARPVKRRVNDINELPVVFDVDENPKPRPSSRKKIKVPTTSNTPQSSDIQKYRIPTGLQRSYHGVAYQVQWMMVVALEAQARTKDESSTFEFKTKDFKTEDPDAGKFDDLVWRYETDQPNSYECNFLQAKHILNKEKKITLEQLLGPKQKKNSLNSNKKDKRPFALEKYFLSYRDELKIKYIQNGKINKLIIATNIDFDDDLKSSFDQLQDDIPILDFIQKETGNLKFKKGNFPHQKIIKEQLKNTYDLIKIAMDLGKCVLTNEPLKKDSTLISYWSVLEKNRVIEPSRKFHSHFIKNHQNLSKEAKQLRLAFFQEAFTNMRESLGFNVNYEISNPEELAELIASKIIQSYKDSKNNVTIYTSQKVQDNCINDLAGYVLIEKNGGVRFNSKFWALNELPSDSLKTFRDELKFQFESQIKNTKSHKLKTLKKEQLDVIINKFKEYEFNIGNKDNFKTCKEMLGDKDSFWMSVANFEFNDFERPNLNQSFSKLPSHELKDIEKDINNFFNQLVFVTNCSQEMLNEFIKKKCSWFVGFETDYVAFEFQSKIADALNFKAKEFISTAEDVSQFFDNAKQQIARLILIGSSLVYRAEIKKYDIIFKEDAMVLKLCEFLTYQSKKQIFHIVNKENKLSSIKVLQMLECMHEYQKDGSYIFIRLISLLHLHEWVIKAFESKISNNLLVIECEIVKINLQKLFYQLLQIIKSNNKKKIIFIAQENDLLAGKFKDNFSNYDWYNDERNNLIDLTYDSQKNLLKKGKAIFQGKKVSLDPLIDNESKLLINGEILCKIINNEMIEIGKAITDSIYDDVKDYYIDRTFHQKVKIRKDYKNEKFKFLETKSSEINEQELELYDDILLISNTCEIFKELCAKYKQRNIHWVMNETNDLIWNQSYGSLSSLREILDTYEQSVQEYKPEKITDITDRVIILTAEPGMGKSFVLNYLALKTKESDPSLWVIRINLIDCSTELEKEIEKNKKIDEADAIRFLYKVVGFKLFNKKRKEKMIEKILSAINIQDGKIGMKFHGEEIHDSNLLEIRLFNNFYNQGRIILLFDGFDEICPDYEEKTIELLQTLKNTKVKKLWITSRYATSVSLEDKLSVFSYSLKPFLTEEQNSFFRKFWKAELDFRELDEQRAVVFINELQNKLPESIDFMSIPLHAYMIAEVFKDAFKDFHDSKEQNMSDECKQKIEKQDLVTLYDKFFYIKFRKIRFGEKKSEINNSEIDMKNMIKGVYENSIRNHRILGLYAIFNHNEVEKLVSPEEIKEASKFMNNVKLCNEKTGIIEQIVNNKPSFVHRTFAEYFVSSYFWEKFKSVEKDFENCIERFIINNLIKDNRIQISRFLQLEAKKDFESNINLPFMQDKLRILFIKLLDQTKQYDKQSTKLLFGIIEFSDLKHDDYLDVEGNDRLKLLCLSAEMGYIKLANGIGTKLTETYLKNYLNSDKWFFSPLWLATKNAHKNVVQFLVEKCSYSAYWKDKDNAILINRIIQRKNFKVLRSCLKFNILNGKPYIDENNKESLPISKVLDSNAPLDVVKLLIEKTDSDHFKAVPYNSYTMFHMIMFSHKYDKEITELLIKKGCNFSEAINLLIFEFIGLSLCHPIQSRRLAYYDNSSFCTEQEFLSLFEKIELLLKCGIGYNCLSCKNTYVTTLQYAEQIYYIHKLLEGVYKLHKQNNDKSKSPIDTVLKLIIDCISGSSDFKGYDIDKPSNINLIFSRKFYHYSDGICENVSLLPSELLQELGLNEEINTNLIEDSLNKLRSYISNAEEEIDQFKTYRDSKTYNDILNGYEEMFQYSYNLFSNIEEKKERFKSLNPFVRRLLKRVLHLYIFQDYEVDDALEELSDEVLKFSNIIDWQKKNAHLKNSINTENILNILALKSIDTNENLQHFVLKIHDSYGISYLNTAWLYLRFLGKKRIMGILKLMFKFSDQSLKVFELLKKLDSFYKTLTEAIENQNYEAVNNILQDIIPDHFIKAIINGQDDKFGSPLHYAAFKGDIITIQILLKYGVNPNLKLMENSKLLCTTEETEEYYDLIGKTSLDLATKYGHEEVAKILLSHGADVNT